MAQLLISVSLVFALFDILRDLFLIYIQVIPHLKSACLLYGKW